MRSFATATAVARGAVFSVPFPLDLPWHVCFAVPMMGRVQTGWPAPRTKTGASDRGDTRVKFLVSVGVGLRVIGVWAVAVGLQVTRSLAGPISSSGTIAEVRPHQGVATLFINNEPKFPIAMIPIADYPTQACAEFGRAGVKIYSHIIWNWRNITPGKDSTLTEPNRWWLGPGRYEFGKVDRRLKAVLEADPDAYLLPRVKLDPPQWWLDAHPDEITGYPDGTRGPQHSMASRAWEETYERMLRDLIGHIEASDYSARVIGYHLAGGKTSEWFWWGFDKGWIDYSPSARARFREWLRDRYRGDAGALRAAWRDTSIAFESAEPPGSELRETTEYGLFRDAATARPAIDYARFLSEITAHNIVRSCRIVKKLTGGHKITGALYGYMLHFAHCRHIVANEGMCGLAQVLASPYVDFLSSPPQYERRRGGDPGLFQSGYFGSYRLHNKFFWQEADERTHLAAERVNYKAADMGETLGMLDRQFGHALAQMNGLWWFTLAGDETFSDERIMDRITTISHEAAAAIAHRGQRRCDVALFADEDVYAWMQLGPGALMYPLVTDMRRTLSRSGVPHDFYLLSDIGHRDLPDYKMYVFLNGFRVSTHLREAIRNKTRRNNAVTVWFYAPGFLDEHGGFNEEGIADLTGIRVRHVLESAAVGLKLSDKVHALTAGLADPVASIRDPIAPVFFADDPEARVLGDLMPVGKPGLAVREFDTWRSVYFAGPTMSAELFRRLTRYAGGHVYSESDDVFDANSRYIMLHASAPGPKTVHLPGIHDVRNVITGRVLARAASALTLHAERVGQTYLLELLEPSR